MKTQNEIFPLLVTKCESLGWKLNKNLSARKNLQTLINKVNRLEDKIKSGVLETDDEKKARKTLLKAMNELGQTLRSLKAIERSLNSDVSKNIEESFKAKDSVTLWTEMLRILENTEKVRKNSTEFLEAWVEIEANHFTKVSLYNIEIEKRALKI